MADFESRIVRWFKNLGRGTTNSSNNVDTEMGGVIADRQPNFVDEERARLMIQMFDFETAISVLEDLPPTQGQQLLLLECYFEVGRGSEAFGCVDHLQDILTSYPRPKAAHLMELINAYISTSYNIRALVLLRCASELYELESASGRANDALVAIESCSYKSFCIIDAMVAQGERMRQVAEEFGPKFMLTILENLRMVTGCNENKKLEYEARCLNNVGLCYRAIKSYHRSIKYFRTGVRLLKRNKYASISSNRTLGALLRNMGLVLHEHGNYPAAGSLYLQSLNAFGKAEKQESESKKRKLSDRTKTL